MYQIQKQFEVLIVAVDTQRNGRFSFAVTHQVVGVGRNDSLIIHVLMSEWYGMILIHAL